MKNITQSENIEIKTVNSEFGTQSYLVNENHKRVNENHKRVNEIAEMLKLHRDTVSYRIKELGIVATQKWWYDEYQIELIKDFERSPRTKYSTVESKINKL